MRTGRRRDPDRAAGWVTDVAMGNSQVQKYQSHETVWSISAGGWEVQLRRVSGQGRKRGHNGHVELQMRSGWVKT